MRRVLLWSWARRIYTSEPGSLDRPVCSAWRETVEGCRKDECANDPRVEGDNGGCERRVHGNGRANGRGGKTNAGVSPARRNCRRTGGFGVLQVHRTGEDGGREPAGIRKDDPIGAAWQGRGIGDEPQCLQSAL